MFSPAGNRVPHPGWLHYDLDVDDQSTIACQSCPQRYGRREVMSTLLAHVMIVHDSSDCYQFKRATGFFGQERELLKLDEHHPGWKYFEAVNESYVACRACKKVQIHADVGRLLKHLQRAHPKSNFTDFRGAVSDLDGGSNAANVRQVKEEKREPVSEEDGGVGTLPVANNNDAIDDKSRIALIVSGEAKSSTTPAAVLSTPLVGSVALPQSQLPSIPVAPAIPSVSALPLQSLSTHMVSASIETPSNSTLPLIPPSLQEDPSLPSTEGTAAPPTSPTRHSSMSSESSESGESDVSEYNPTRRTGPKAKGKLTQSLFHLHTVTDRMTRKWKFQKKMPLSAFKKPKGLIFYHSYWTNGCQKRYYKCGKVQCPYRMLAVNNKDWMKVFQYRHHAHPFDENSFSSCSTSASSSRTSSTSDSSSG